ncbi:unnamed protein product [Mucor hiemalis]
MEALIYNSPPSPPDSSTNNTTTTTNSTTIKKKKLLPAPPFNSDSLLNGIGDYIFESPLGGGKFSKVMLSHHYLTGEKVAIKMISKKEHKYRVMSRLVREISIMEALDHQNVVKLYETYETADTLYIIMEYVPGYNLEEHLKSIDKSIIPEDQARDIFRQVVKAVDHCHSRWIVHRDLKTPNILLTPDHKVKIADFGLGNRFGLQRLRTVCGSLLYYSPEIMTARSYIGPEVDSWCLGIMLYRMTAGLELFSHARTQPELRKLIISHRYKLSSRLSPELQDTIKKFLAVDRFDRLSLKSFLDDDPWINDFGRLNNVFEERIPNPLYHAHDVTEAYATSIRAEDNTRIQLCSQNSKRLHIQDIKEERRRGFRVPKTVIYHITNASTYFTGTAPHSSQQPIDLDEQRKAKAELHESILVTLKQVGLQQVHNVGDLKSPISHLFRKFKRTESAKLMEQHPTGKQKQLRHTASALNLSQLYQRVAKDHISYFTIQCNIRTGSSTTFVSGYSTSSTFASSSTANTLDQRRAVPPHRQQQRSNSSKRLSHRLSMVFFSNTQPEFNMSTHNDYHDPEQDKRNQSELLRIVRMACDILGITYYQASGTQLVCLLTLKNCKKSVIVPAPSQPQQSQHQQSLLRSKFFTSNDRLSDMNRSHGQASTISNFSSYNGSNVGWWSRQINRLSAQFNSQSNLDNTTQIFGASSHALTSSHDILNLGRTEQELQIQQQQQNEDDNDDAKPEKEEGSSDGFVILSIDASSVSSSKCNDDGSPVQIVSLRYSKIKGSTKVFKLAKGWIQKILSQNDDLLTKGQQLPQQQRMMSKSEAEAYFKSTEFQHHQFNDSDVIRL